MDGEAGEESTKQWRRVRIFLELLQHKANISDAHTLVPTLFVLLARWVSWWFSWGESFTAMATRSHIRSKLDQ